MEPPPSLHSNRTLRGVAQQTLKCAKRLECVQLAGAVVSWGAVGKREQAPRTPNASRRRRGGGGGGGGGGRGGPPPPPPNPSPPPLTLNSRRCVKVLPTIVQPDTSLRTLDIGHWTLDFIPIPPFSSATIPLPAARAWPPSTTSGPRRPVAGGRFAAPLPSDAQPRPCVPRPPPSPPRRR